MYKLHELHELRVTMQGVLLRVLPHKRIWESLWDLPPNMPRQIETRVSLCELILICRVISFSSAIHV